MARKAAGAPEVKRSRTRLTADERRRSIIQAAQEVFSRTSFHGARTRDVARAAEVNQATLFQHFNTKEELFEAAVIQPLIDSMRGLADRARAYDVADTAEDFRALAGGGTRRYIEVLSEVFPLLAAALFSDRETGKAFYREQVLPLLRERAAVLGPFVKAPIDPEILELINFGMLFAVVMDQEFGDGTRDLDRVVEQLMLIAESRRAK